KPPATSGPRPTGANTSPTTSTPDPLRREAERAPDDLAALWMGASYSSSRRWAGRARAEDPVQAERDQAGTADQEGGGGTGAGPPQAHPKRRMSGTWPGARVAVVAVKVLSACAPTAPRAWRQMRRNGTCPTGGTPAAWRAASPCSPRS